MKQKIIIVGTIVIASSIIIKLLLVCFSTKTALEYAEKQSELKLPKGIKLIKFEQNWKNTNGDGSRYIEFDLTKDEAENLEIQCLKEKYFSLPIKENGYNPFFSKKTDRGYYKLKLLSSHDSRHERTILDLSKRKLYLITEIL